ncbi:MAG TPA: hypothetical protein VFO19_15800 [Vicinamibacterales bacterium]|nr:hypothetical protein [Vicinamibacterales bacterium]
MSTTPALPLGAALKRGAIVALANWPVLVIDFLAESLYKVALIVPIVGGAFMVAAVFGADIRELIADGLRETADQVLGTLSTAPAGFFAFLAAIGIVALGGAMLMFIVKAGTLARLVDGERRMPELPPGAVAASHVRRAARFTLARTLDDARHFARRSALLTCWLGVVYAIGTTCYLTALGLGFSLPDRPWASALWPLIVLVATSTTVVGVSIVHFVHDLLRIIVITDDCRVSEAMSRLRAFLIVDVRQVLGIFAVMTVVVMFAGAIALLVTGSLALVAWVPFLGLLAVPLQIAAWLVRGLLFQGLSLMAVSSYQTQYRRFSPVTSEVPDLEPFAESSSRSS